MVAALGRSDPSSFTHATRNEKCDQDGVQFGPAYIVHFCISVVDITNELCPIQYCTTKINNT
jgi:hypothetical protein